MSKLAQEDAAPVGMCGKLAHVADALWQVNNGGTVSQAMHGRCLYSA